VELERFFWGGGIQYALDEPLPGPLGLTFGVDYDRQDDDRLRFDNEEGTPGARVFDQEENVAIVGAYVLGRYEPDAPWRLSAGLRYDRVTFDVGDRFLSDGDQSGEIEFDQVSPSLGASLALGDHVLFASFASSFETPTTTELANPSGAGGFNAALEPQRADNFEAGIKGERGGLYYELAAFHIELTDELVPFELPEFPGRTFFANAGESERTGLEAAVSWRGDRGLAVDASWTWSDFTFERFTDDVGNDFAGRRLPGVPEHFGFLGMAWESDGGFYVRLDARYSGTLYADNANSVSVASYTVASFRASRAFDLGPWRIRPYLGVNNLFDERYASHVRTNAFGGRYFEPAPGRNAYAGIDVRYAFGGK
jgi:iron complex outermembrane receptor protein